MDENMKNAPQFDSKPNLSEEDEEGKVSDKEKERTPNASDEDFDGNDLSSLKSSKQHMITIKTSSSSSNTSSSDENAGKHDGNPRKSMKVKLKEVTGKLERETEINAVRIFFFVYKLNAILMKLLLCSSN